MGSTLGKGASRSSAESVVTISMLKDPEAFLDRSSLPKTATFYSLNMLKPWRNHVKLFQQSIFMMIFIDFPTFLWLFHPSP